MKMKNHAEIVLKSWRAEHANCAVNVLNQANKKKSICVFCLFVLCIVQTLRAPNTHNDTASFALSKVCALVAC